MSRHKYRLGVIGWERHWEQSRADEHDAGHVCRESVAGKAEERHTLTTHRQTGRQRKYQLIKSAKVILQSF